MYRLMLLLSPIFLLAALGCGSGPGFPAAPISGTVKFKGKLVPQGAVSFVSADKKSGSGVLGKDGHYVVAAAPIGPAKVTIATPTSSPKAMPGMVSGPVVVVPAAYANDTRTTITFEVKPGSNQFDIEIQ